MTAQGPYGHVFFTDARPEATFNSPRNCVGCGATAEQITQNARCHGTHRYNVATLMCEWCGLTMELIERMEGCTNDPDVGFTPPIWWTFNDSETGSGKVPGMETSSPTLSPEQRTKKVAQITSLLAKTVERGCTADEEAASKVKADELMAKYGIDRSECVENTKAPRPDLWDVFKRYAEQAQRANEEAEKLRKAEQARKDQERRNEQARQAYAKSSTTAEGYARHCPHGLGDSYCIQCDIASRARKAYQTRARQACQHGNMGPCSECTQENSGSSTDGFFIFTDGADGTPPSPDDFTNMGYTSDEGIKFTGTQNASYNATSGGFHVHKNRSHKNCTHESTKVARDRCRKFNEGYVP